MVSSAVAFCPGHISGYFKRVNGTSIPTTGSIGGGIVIDEGVRTIATIADAPTITVRHINKNSAVISEINGSAPIEYVMNQLGVSAAITTECRLPIGAGFGLSAAALLSTITALSALFELKKTEHEIAALAHEAEIVHRTGLGDVAACQDGGLACRLGPGIDAEIVRRKNIVDDIVAVSFGPLDTPSVLDSDEQMKWIPSSFPNEYPKTIEEFFKFSRMFADRSGLISDDVAWALHECDSHSIPASMTMLGRGIFALGMEAADVLGEFGEVWQLKVADAGVRLVEMIG
jgi:pantoate kinase